MLFLRHILRRQFWTVAAAVKWLGNRLLLQTTHTKGADIEALLQRLSDVNDSMTNVLSGSSDARLHTLGRHRDLLHDYNQVSLSFIIGGPSQTPLAASQFATGCPLWAATLAGGWKPGVLCVILTRRRRLRRSSGG